MVALNDSNLAPRFPSRAHPRVQGSIFATKHQTVHQGPSLTRSVSHFQALQGKSTSSPKRLHRVDHSNQQYSILALTDTSGSVVERVAYQAYGHPTFMNAAGTTLSSSAKATRYSYTGREWDPSLELHHFRARWMSGVSGRFLGRDVIDRMLDSSNLYAYLTGRSLLLLDPSGHVSISLDGINIDPGTTVRPRHSGCHCNMDCDSMKPDDVIVTPSFPGKNSRCVVKFVCNKCDLEGEGGEIGSAPDPIRNPKFPDPDGDEPEMIPGDVFTVTLCDRGIQSCSLYTDVVEHELVHARDFCNPFVYPKFPDIVGDWSQYDRCIIREKRAYRRECENRHPGKPVEVEKCLDERAKESCAHWNERT